jgi:hypothetical protein
MNTYSIVCPEDKMRLWIGQGWSTMTNFYSGEPDTMCKLGEFLQKTQGKNLIVICNDSDEKYSDCEEYENPECDKLKRVPPLGAT